MVLLGLLTPAIVSGSESARLTIGGHVPPTQRIALVQAQTTTDGRSVAVFQEQNNSALGYAISVEARTLETQPLPPPKDGFKQVILPARVTLQPTGISRGRLSRREATARVLEIAPLPDSPAVVVLTVACH